MLTNMEDLLAVAQRNHFTIPAFDIGGDQLLKVVVKKVKELNSPVTLKMSPDEFSSVGDTQIQATIYRAAQADVPVCIHLDHGDFYEAAVRAIRAGMASVMIDASTLPYEENVAVTKKAVEAAHVADVFVKSELGIIDTADSSIEGGTQGVIYTVPKETKQFIGDAGANTFTVATGTAHGIYPEDMKPELCVDILRDIISKVDAPLVLHGGSNDKGEEVATVVDNGICRIDISSDIKVAFYTQCHKTLNENPGYRGPLKAYPEVMEVCGKVVEEKIYLLKPNDKVKYYY